MRLCRGRNLLFVSFVPRVGVDIFLRPTKVLFVIKLGSVFCKLLHDVRTDAACLLAQSLPRHEGQTNEKRIFPAAKPHQNASLTV